MEDLKDFYLFYSKQKKGVKSSFKLEYIIQFKSSSNSFQSKVRNRKSSAPIEQKFINEFFKKEFVY